MVSIEIGFYRLNSIQNSAVSLTSRKIYVPILIDDRFCDLSFPKNIVTLRPFSKNGDSSQNSDQSWYQQSYNTFIFKRFLFQINHARSQQDTWLKLPIQTKPKKNSGTLKPYLQISTSGIKEWITKLRLIWADLRDHQAYHQPNSLEMEEVVNNQLDLWKLSCWFFRNCTTRQHIVFLWYWWCKRKCEARSYQSSWKIGFLSKRFYVLDSGKVFSIYIA